VFVFAVIVCFELYGQILENDAANITTFSGISAAADRHVNLSKTGIWRNFWMIHLTAWFYNEIVFSWREFLHMCVILLNVTSWKQSLYMFTNVSGMKVLLH